MIISAGEEGPGLANSDDRFQSDQMWAYVDLGVGQWGTDEACLFSGSPKALENPCIASRCSVKWNIRHAACERREPWSIRVQGTGTGNYQQWTAAATGPIATGQHAILHAYTA